MKRRNFLKIGAGTAATLVGFQVLAAESAAEQCSRLLTPRQPEGPFYPVVDQVDTDADLIQLSGAHQIAEGQIIVIEGQVKDQRCNPVQGALVEIWQACHSGRYNHPSDPSTAELDPNFQYWGKAVTDISGHYRFRTILPGAYPADEAWIRPPHIHYKISKKGYLELITQMYFKGYDELNEMDLILNRLSALQRKEVVVELKKREDIPHPVGVFDIKIEKL